MAVISNCDADDDWSGHATASVLSIDTTDKKEGAGSLVDTIAEPVATTNYATTYNPDGTWDWSAEKHILLWLKSNRGDGDFSFAQLVVVDASSVWRAWDLTFTAGEWTAIKKLLLTGDSQSGALDLASIQYFRIQFQAADTTAFYRKIDHVRVIVGGHGGIFMNMDMRT